MKQGFNNLLERYIADQLTEEELKIFLDMARMPENAAAIEAQIGQLLESDQLTDLTDGMDIDRQFRLVLEKAQQEKKTSPRIISIVRQPWWAAAAILLLAVAGLLFYMLQPSQGPALAVVQAKDILPGNEGAVLTLADGRKIILDTLANGIISTQNGSEVALEDGKLSYKATGNVTEMNSYNTMSTPRGRQFQLMLPDGTRVWLNAESSIHYPTSFTGDERRVIVTGEAYFEVARGARQPFFVQIGTEAEVKVLGTHFNVNAYQDDGAIRTTLLEGAVAVSLLKQPAATAVRLQPGQQAWFNDNDPEEIKTSVTDTEKVMAWRNGFFNFDGANIRVIMKQLERWYDISVVYDKNAPNTEFFGEMSRNVNLAELIVTLEQMGVRLKMEPGRKLRVLQ